MIAWLQHIETVSRGLAAVVPLELFVFLGALIEEVIAPIPSMLVMTTAGLFAQFEGRTAFFVMWLVLLGNLGKLLGSYFYYFLGDKLEDVVVGRYGRYLGLHHADIERIGQRFTGSPWRDGVLLFMLRVIPFVPTIVVSIGCGVIRIRTRVFLIASYTGNVCKDLFYAMAGYYGVHVLRSYFMDIERVRFGVGVLLLVGAIVSIVMAYMHRHRGLHLYRRFIQWFRRP